MLSRRCAGRYAAGALQTEPRPSGSGFRGKWPMNQFYTGTDHFVLVPAMMLALFGCAILLFDFAFFPDPRQRKYLLFVLILGEGLAGFGLWNQQANLANGAIEAFHGSLVMDGISLFFGWIFIAATVIDRKSTRLDSSPLVISY